MKIIQTSFLIIATLIFSACGENTKTPITKDISSIDINETTKTVNSTDKIVLLGANANYDDGSSAEVTNFVTWNNSDYSLLSMYNGAILPISNGGDANITIEYGKFNDSIKIKVLALKQNTLSIFPISSDINSTGSYEFVAKGDFIDLDTNLTIESNVTIVKNIIWTTTNGAIVTITDDIAQIQLQAGDTNVTATVFKDVNLTVTASYFIN